MFGFGFCCSLFVLLVCLVFRFDFGVCFAVFGIACLFWISVGSVCRFWLVCWFSGGLVWLFAIWFCLWYLLIFLYLRR